MIVLVNRIRAPASLYREDKYYCKRDGVRVEKNRYELIIFICLTMMRRQTRNEQNISLHIYIAYMCEKKFFFKWYGLYSINDGDDDDTM